MSGHSESQALIGQAQNAYQASGGIAALKARVQNQASAPGGIDVRAAKKTAEEFEAVFIAEMLKPMFQNIEPAEPFGGGQAGKMWQEMQVAEYGKAISKAGGIGIADAVFREMIKAQEQGR